MEIKDIIPSTGFVQRNICDDCGTHLELQFIAFSEMVSSIFLEISGLPMLVCSRCGKQHFPDRTRLAILHCHEESRKAGKETSILTRRKPNKHFGFTDVPFLYDSDDYFHIPGLWRDHNEGFLTPVFFNREVLLKFDQSPRYAVQFASTTYGTIYGPEYSVSFGINRFGRVVMWLGDIAKLPLEDQYYLRSENVVSDHSVGSEFYDGQIECVFTDPSKEDVLFAARSEFVDEVYKKFGHKIAHLDKEVVDAALSCSMPLFDTEKERKHTFDLLNKIYVESFANDNLLNLCTQIGAKAKGEGSLKRLQAFLEHSFPDGEISKTLAPLYVLYDLRVAYSHLISVDRRNKMLEDAGSRIGFSASDTLQIIYEKLLHELTNCFRRLKECL